MPTERSRALPDRYRLVREVGRGGMATVYLAEDLKHGRQVAIKVMDPQLAAAIGPDRFLREIEIAARLTHPHILPLFDSGAVDGHFYYVMPYIEGESLRARLGREKQLGLEEALRLAREIASGLNHAHRHGLIHRDIKPENVLLADGIALVADFGIARAIASSAPGDASTLTRAPATTAGSVLGTPRYMSPEQAVGGEVDERSDLYALACVLYEMLAGVPPFVAPSETELIRLHLTATPRDIADLRPNVPPGVAAAIKRALAKLPADRFAGMTPFAEAIAIGMSAESTPTPVAERTPTVTPHNLPRQRSRFIGREKELAECALLLGDTRVLTLTGVGGSGKTRLAVRLAEGLLDTYPDGVWFVDLAPIDAEPLIAQVVATSIGAEAKAGQSVEAAVLAQLERKRALIVLDNCEHLLAATAEFADWLLAALPDLKLLITSREGLGFEGERLFPVRSLALPRAGEDTDPETLLRTEAAKLFVDRAHEGNPEFGLDRTNAPIVADICRRLDGIPLAIELAAARTRALTVEQIARMLDDRFRLLTGGSRSMMERHRTLRATVQWSYDHLDADERSLFLALTVFAGGWTLKAAAHLTQGDEFDVLDRLTRLIDKSMVITDRGAGAEARYRMLETLRQFGLEMLATSGEADELRSAHLGYFLETVRGMEEDLRVAFVNVLREKLEPDVDNLRAALTWGYQHDPLRAVELAGRLVAMWFRPGYWAEGRRWYEQTIALGDAAAPADRSAAYSRSARLAFWQGEYEEAMRLFLAAVEIHRSLGDHRRAARDLARCGAIHAYGGRHDEARPYYEEALALHSVIEDPVGRANLENSLGLSDYLRGSLVEARRRFESALATYRESGSPGRVSTALGNLGTVDVAEGDAAGARRHLLESFTINRALENLYGMASFLPALAETIRMEGNAITAGRLLGVADALLERLGAQLEALERGVYDRTVAALRTEIGDEELESLRRDGRAMTWQDALALAGV